MSLVCQQQAAACERCCLGCGLPDGTDRKSDTTNCCLLKRPGYGAQVRAEEGSAESALGPEDEVEFTVVANRRTGAFRAEDVRLLCKAELRRELGQVRMLGNV